MASHVSNVRVDYAFLFFFGLIKPELELIKKKRNQHKYNGKKDYRKKSIKTICFALHPFVIILNNNNHHRHCFSL